MTELPELSFPPIETLTIFPKPNHNAWHVDTRLFPTAEYGRLAFDVYALEHWGNDLPAGQDQEQWDRLVKQYLALGARGRQHYELLSKNAQNQARSPGYVEEGNSPTMPTQGQIDRIFRPHQTIQERNVCAKDSGTYNHSVMVWLRTCYIPELEDKYHEMATKAEVGGNTQTTVYVVDDNHILDNRDTYDYGAEWTRILARLPELGSGWPICWPAEEDEWTRWEEAMDMREAEGDTSTEPFPPKQDQWPRALIYVVDEGALRENMVKIFWLNQFGECIWENKIHPGSMHSMNGRIADGCISDYIYDDDRGGVLG